MRKVDKSSKKAGQELTKEHQLLLKKGVYSSNTQLQCTQAGDQFEKFTMYESYTPVKTSTTSGVIG